MSSELVNFSTNIRKKGEKRDNFYIYNIMKKNFKKTIYLLVALIISATAMTSCIKDELPNIEVDITNVTSNDAGFVKSVINENSVSVFVDTTKCDLTNLGLTIEISKGATIEPDPRTVTDYSEPRYFQVTSQDQEWTKIWEVNTRIVSEDFPTKYNFKNWVNPTSTAYLIPVEKITGSGGKEENLYAWATTNSSMSIVLAWIYGQNLNPYVFGVCPTDPQTNEGLKLETIDIHLLVPAMGYVSGTTFIGEFDAVQQDPNMGTKFGTPFNRKPLKLKGSYSYQPGTVPATGKLDNGIIRAVLFRTTDEKDYLDGYEIMNMNGDRIIGYADFTPDHTTSGYETFDLDFVYNQEVDPEELSNWQYAMTVYFTSSKEGYKYVGAGATKLMIDYAELVCEEKGEDK